MEGYNKLANLIGAHHEAAIFRTFMSANARDLLYRQAELLHLQAEWARLVAQDQLSGDKTRREYDTYYDKLRRSKDDREGDTQWGKFLEIRQNLKEYNEALLTFQSLCNLPQVDKSDLHTLRDWLERPEGGSQFLRGTEKKTWQKEAERDLTSLAAHTSEENTVPQWIKGPVLDWFHDWLGNDFKKDLELFDPFLEDTKAFPLKKYSSTAISNTINIFSTILSSLLPTMAIFALYFVRPPLTRMGMILAFNFIFSAVLALFAKAKRADCFAATAAFAAVQVVFIGGSDMTECKCAAST